MQGKIVFKFEKGGELVASLLQDTAPETVKAFLEMLPLQATVYHSRWSGREINFPVRSNLNIPRDNIPRDKIPRDNIPRDNIPWNKIPRENQTTQTNRGDVIYWREWEKEGHEVSEAIAIYYGAEVTRDHRGYQPVNVFARISESQWNTIEEIGLRIWQHGIEKVNVEIIK